MSTASTNSSSPICSQLVAIRAAPSGMLSSKSHGNGPSAARSRIWPAVMPLPRRLALSAASGRLRHLLLHKGRSVSPSELSRGKGPGWRPPFPCPSASPPRGSPSVRSPTGSRSPPGRPAAPASAEAAVAWRLAAVESFGAPAAASPAMVARRLVAPVAVRPAMPSKPRCPRHLLEL